jgi:hypothetical protein
MAYGTTSPFVYVVVDGIMDFIFMTDVGLNFITGKGGAHLKAEPS